MHMHVKYRRVYILQTTSGQNRHVIMLVVFCHCIFIYLCTTWCDWTSSDWVSNCTDFILSDRWQWSMNSFMHQSDLTKLRI